jgi:hypothetical protein
MSGLSVPPRHNSMRNSRSKAPAGKPVCPDPATPGFTQLIRHYGSVKGAWPRIVEESVDM